MRRVATGDRESPAAVVRWFGVFEVYLQAMRDGLSAQRRLLSSVALSGIVALGAWGAMCLHDRLAVRRVDPPRITTAEDRWHSREEPSVVQPERLVSACF